MTFAKHIALATVLAAVPAAAQPAGRSSDTTVAAEALFREGKRLMQDHKIAEACDKFDASERLDDSVGTLLNLGDCREKNNQLATAWATFLKAASDARSAGDVTRETEGRRRATALEPRLSYLTISVPDANRVEGLVIKRGEATIDPALWNQGVPVDAGSYEISGQAPGHEPWSTKVQIQGEAQKASVEVPRFKQLTELSKSLTAKAEPTAPASTVTTTATANANEDEDERPAQRSRFTTLRKASIAAAALGVAGLAGGVGFGLQANSLQHQANAICPDTMCGDAHALSLNRSAQHDAVMSDVMFGVGGAAVAGAVVLWFVGAPHATASDRMTFAPVIAPGQVGVTLARGF